MENCLNADCSCFIPGGILEIIKLLFSLLTIGIAIWGITSWKNQIVWKKRFEESFGLIDNLGKIIYGLLEIQTILKSYNLVFEHMEGKPFDFIFSNDLFDGLKKTKGFIKDFESKIHYITGVFPEISNHLYRFENDLARTIELLEIVIKEKEEKINTINLPQLIDPISQKVSSLQTKYKLIINSIK